MERRGPHLSWGWYPVGEWHDGARDVSQSRIGVTVDVPADGDVPGERRLLLAGGWGGKVCRGGCRRWWIEDLSAERSESLVSASSSGIDSKKRGAAVGVAVAARTVVPVSRYASTRSCASRVELDTLDRLPCPQGRIAGRDCPRHHHGSNHDGGQETSRRGQQLTCGTSRSPGATVSQVAGMLLRALAAEMRSHRYPLRTGVSG